MSGRPMPNERDFESSAAITPIDDGKPDAPLRNQLGPWPSAADEAPPFALPLEDFIAQRDEQPDALIGTPDDALLPRAGLAILAALPGKGKTTLLVDLAFHLASGLNWLGLTVTRPLRVLIVENEGPREPFRRKLEQKHKAWTEPIEGALLVHVQRWGALRLDDDDSRDDLRAALRTEPPIDVVIGDPLGSLGVRGVGSPADTRDFLHLAIEAGLFRDTAFAFAHHFRHGSTRGDSAGDELDELSGAWAGHADAILVLKDSDGDRARLSFPKLRWAEPRRPLILERLRDVASFRVVAEEGISERDIEGEILKLLADGAWRTAEEVAVRSKGGIGKRRKTVEEILERLVREGELEYAEGPEGRSSDSKCWRLSRPRDDLGQPPAHHGSAGLSEHSSLSVGERVPGRPPPDGCPAAADEPGEEPDWR